MDGKQAATAIRKYEELLDPDTTTAPARRVDNRIPIIAVSATLLESQHVELGVNFDGWMLKPIDFKRMLHILAGISEPEKRAEDAYQRGQWERGGWLNGELGKRDVSHCRDANLVLDSHQQPRNIFPTMKEMVARCRLQQRKVIHSGKVSTRTRASIQVTPQALLIITFNTMPDGQDP